MVGKRSMDEDDGFAGALFDVGQANAIDLDFFGQWASGWTFWSRLRPIGVGHKSEQ
jgi:hypothetical protein